MHEMSIAMSLIEIATTEAARHRPAVIRAIHAEIGELAGVEIESLRFCYEAARANTAAAEAELVIRRVPGRGRCAACGREVALPFLLAVCPECAAPGLELVSGRELRVTSLAMDDAPEGALEGE